MSLVTLKLVCTVVCEASGYSLTDLRSERRAADLVLNRHVAMWLGRELTERSISYIGRFFGRDHTTVLHACRKIDGLRMSLEELRTYTDGLGLAVEAAALALSAAGRAIPEDIDAIAVARKMTAFPGMVHTVSTDETLAMATELLGATEQIVRLETCAEQIEEAGLATRALADAVETYLQSHEQRNAPARRDRIEAGAAILNARKHLEHTLQQWRGHHGNHEDHVEEVECAGSGHAR